MQINNYKWLLIIILIFFVASCATTSQKNTQKILLKEKVTNYKVPDLKPKLVPVKEKEVNIRLKEEFKIENKKELEKEISEIHEDLFINNHIKLVINKEVKKFIKLYSRKNGKWLYNAFKRAYIWLPYMRQIFKDYGLPEELVYLSFIESHFKFKSRSRAGAVGPWQFMRRTARKFGLKIDWWIDERRDPIKSTEAAAKYLKYLYSLFGSYELALAGYNAGENKIIRAIKRYRTKDYWKICKKRFLKRETKGYVPSFYAVLYLIRNNANLNFVPDEWINYKKKDIVFVHISKPYSLYGIAKKTGIKFSLLKAYNPELIRNITPPSHENYLLKVPKKYEPQLIAFAKNIDKNYKYSFKTYTIKKGDTLYKIAKRFKIYPISILKQLNNIKNVRALRINSKIILPIPKYKKYTPTKRMYAKRTKKTKITKIIKYKVRKGDNLWKLSNRFKTSVKEIVSLNNLQDNKIYPGDILRIKIYRR